MATIQTVFDLVEATNREIQLQTGEADVTRALAVYNMAKWYFETRMATKKDILGNEDGTVATAASTEKTTFPAGVLRIDALWLVDPATSRPRGEPLTPIYQTGGHARGSTNSLYSSSSTSPGEPEAYWTNGTNIYWSPTPDGIHTVRWYGFKEATEATAASDPFLYPSVCVPAFAAFMAHVFRVGLDDPIEDAMMLAIQLFDPLTETLSNFRREKARTPTYRSVHRV